ncbi:1-(5-phosphoribosyl)-5-[(5-phosphoribosylamino)methylideneamino]imidazole-4-carboxamide isomerase [Tunicatimonas pelagia]|uniref:1-(5-phosphoribosyl)-5-[(5- phosphoribosylamino)methylideneamino]imidazole-4- carboxamide isomerase n=1 Tax=Tunicatimonas pelagia TaxID=931531 RepID=UPI0026667B03|nr:1-(5-phosphoribosyl)-5-[(5-phosphoribosylamino)methylideneamino]imidazole-4-carboxamide isomerase [Tunicatimonas pelagia]WKN40514.1 1-(5-phosphoribosyl)-5-[(5-phosphoribosylamino)methylideneamino]imidazole-4-carboxamide isomerase [Tunicatimonas pelagia]
MEIIPAIDIIGGKCVRLTQGDYDQKKEYDQSPLEVAKQLEGHGIRRLHLVDLDGAKQKKVINLNILETIASQTQLRIDFGGGVQSDEDLQRVFSAGAQQVTGGSIAVRQPDTFLNWLEQHGNEKIILGADAKDRKIAVHGWQEKTEWAVLDFIEHYHAKGIEYVICTDVAKDGLLQGPSLKLYQDILRELPQLKLIASGGVTTIDDLHRLKKADLYGVIIGKALLEGRIKLNELKEFVYR